MTEKEAKAVTCPFCGAPYREVIPTDALQLECHYCGGIFLVPPEIRGGISQCLNHPDRLAVGICNDCGENFCSECLHIYNLQIKNTETTLYLCPECLKERHNKETDSVIYAGVFFLFFSGVCAFIGMSTEFSEGFFIAISFFVLGIGIASYGFLKRSELPQELTVGEVRVEHEKNRSMFANDEDAEATELYEELLRKYVKHWGVNTGADLLDKEIAAYLRHGADFSEAIKKIYQAQQSKQ